MTLAVRVYVAIAAAVAAGCLALAGWGVPVGELTAHWNALAAFVVLGFLSEAFYLRLRVGQGETSSSVAFIPFIAAILLFETGWAIIVAAVSELAVEFAVRKKPGIKILFNVSQLVVCVSLSSWVYQLFGGHPSATNFAFAPAAIAAAVATYFLVNSTVVSVAVALGDEVPFFKVWTRIGGPSLLYDFASSTLAALLAFLYVKWQLPGLLLVIVPIWFVRHIYHVVFQLEQVNRDLLELMVKAIEARDPYTSGHSLRVAQLAEQIAQERGLSSRLVSQVRTAALLHDVGKIHEDFAPLLRKNGTLDPIETAMMQTHPSRSAELVRTISAFRGVVEDAVRHHHEMFDGSGYPSGLSGQSIPIGSRIIMIADTLDAMTTTRPYRNALSYDKVVSELLDYAGRQFDPALVKIVLNSAKIRSMVSARLSGQAERPFRGLEVMTSRSRRAMRV
jgi:putative nucleotidyltransferase with HDIG domain